MRIFSIILSLSFLGIQLYAQGGSFSDKKVTTQKYAVFFTDKGDFNYSIFEPQAFLSKAAIDRRLDYGTHLSEDDLPVSSIYVQRLRDVGAKVFAYSKWKNVAIVEMDLTLKTKVGKLPFVQSIDYVGKSFKESRDNRRRLEIPKKPFTKYETKYGGAYSQISIMNGEYIHEMGYQGQGRKIAVLDGGFLNVHFMPFFDSLRTRKGFLDVWDVTENDDWVYENSTHGTEVLSTMASNISGLMIGTAPAAEYALYMTEYVASEYSIEEYNWMIGAERADSLGIHLINSSLGYTGFDAEEMDYEYKDLDGNTAICTQAADLAASKGILVVNSAGNSGNDNWKYIGTPADADSILTVGAVNHKGLKAGFSSYGPTKDRRIKPTVSVVGKSTVVASINSYDLSVSDGTSFSSPVMCGMTASLWSAFPEKTNMEIIDALIKSSSISDNPDYKLGYGIPNVLSAYIDLFDSTLDEIVQSDEQEVQILPLMNTDKLEFLTFGTSKQDVYEITVKDELGVILTNEKYSVGDFGMAHYSVDGFDKWSKGGYQVNIITPTVSKNFYFLKP